MTSAMYEWSVGDRVVSVVDSPEGNDDIVVGSTGVVCEILPESDQRNIGVRWDRYSRNQHSCGGECVSGHGWYVYADEIAHELNDEPFEFDEEEFNKLVFGESRIK